MALDFFPDAPPATVDWSQNAGASCRPSRASSRRSRRALANIVKKLDKLPLEEIGDDLRKALAELDQTLVSAHAARVDNADKLIEPNSALSGELSNTLQEVSARGARAARVLADYLERHPEALIRGKTGEAE